ncbi:MAG TPA: BamA/TamA family outer membrane protein [Vicinamibacterales bacterium]|nr:BamA/TamA family outer membrane protein [Vicinamibacterales bacterium]
MCIRSLSFALLALALCASASAQSNDPPASTPEATDLGDVWRAARHKDSSDADAADAESHKRFLVVAPSVGSKPSTGLNGGASGNIAFYRGDSKTTHISTINGGIKLSQKGQTLAGVRVNMFSDGDRWFFQSDNRLSLTSQNTYGLGGVTLPTDAENVKYDFLHLYESMYRNVAPHLFVGGGLNVSDHTHVRPGASAVATWDESAYVAYDQHHGFDVDRQVSGGTSVGLFYDTRDNAINARRGWLASASYRTFFNGFLGGDSNWQELYVDVRTYRKLTKDGRHRLAFWFLGDAVTGGTAPYLDLPATASNDGRSARGYAEGRYRGEHLMYGELEYRGALTSSGLVGVVAFLNTTTVDNSETGERMFDSFAPAAGFGFRFLLNKRSRTNLCTDYGWGKQGSRGFYLAIQEAF